SRLVPVFHLNTPSWTPTSTSYTRRQANRRADDLLCSVVNPDFVSRLVRARNVHGGTAHQGDRYPQGHGRFGAWDHSAFVQGLLKARTDRGGGCYSHCLVLHG